MTENEKVTLSKSIKADFMDVVKLAVDADKRIRDIVYGVPANKSNFIQKEDVATLEFIATSIDTNISEIRTALNKLRE